MNTIKMLVAIIVLAVSSIAFATAVQPVITENVTVIKNAKPEQCKSSMNMDDGVDQETDYSGGGMTTTITSPGVRSCTGCAIDEASGDCVCKTCYDHFDS